MSPRLRYGATTAALLAIGLGYALTQAPAGRSAPRRPAVAPEATVRPTARAPEPTAAEILDRRDALGLTPEQLTRLEALRRAWSVESAGLQAAVDAAAEEFGRFAGEARAAGGASVEEIQRRSAEFRELSTALRERRRRHGGAAAAVLTVGQRTVLETVPRETQGGLR